MMMNLIKRMRTGRLIALLFAMMLCASKASAQLSIRNQTDWNNHLPEFNQILNNVLSWDTFFSDRVMDEVTTDANSESFTRIITLNGCYSQILVECVYNAPKNTMTVIGYLNANVVFVYFLRDAFDRWDFQIINQGRKVSGYVEQPRKFKLR